MVLENLKDSVKMFFSNDTSLKKLVKKENWIESVAIILLATFVANLFQGSILNSVLILLFIVFITFFSMFVFHGFLKLFGAKENIKKTLTIGFNLQVFPTIFFTFLTILMILSSYLSSNLELLFQFIIMVLIFVYFPWFLLIYTVGISKTHNISLGRSYLAIILTFIVTLIILGIILAIIVQSFYLTPEVLSYINSNI